MCRGLSYHICASDNTIFRAQDRRRLIPLAPAKFLKPRSSCHSSDMASGGPVKLFAWGLAYFNRPSDQKWEQNQAKSESTKRSARVLGQLHQIPESLEAREII